MKKNLFIVIEGVDGAGTTTQATLLAARIFENFKEAKILLTREPTGGKYGKQIRQMLKKGKSPKLLGDKFLNLFVKDRAEHLNYLKNIKSIIISDRHKHSTYAYQQAQGVSFEKIHLKHHNFTAPDLTVIIDIPINDAIRRMKGKKNKEMFDKHHRFLNDVRTFYLKLNKQLKEPIAVVDGLGTKEQVANRIWKKVKKLL